MARIIPIQIAAISVLFLWAVVQAVVSADISPSADGTGRTQVTFDYSWRFQLGDPIGVTPTPLTTAALDPTFTRNVSGQVCTNLAYTALGRMGVADCQGACSATPGCLVWQYVPPSGSSGHPPPAGFMPHACYIHDGTRGSDAPSCTPAPSNSLPLEGAAREKAPPPVGERKGVTWATADFDDSAWTRVDLPHDFVRLGNYSEAADSHHGNLPRDTAGWYRKRFRLDHTAARASSGGGGGGGSVWLHFEGVFQSVDVWVDGKHMLHHTSGYLGFDVPLDGFLSNDKGRGGGGDGDGGSGFANNTDGIHTIALRADASYGSGHWYEGGGIQRRVWLMETNGPARLVTDGGFAPTPVVTATTARVQPTAEVTVPSFSASAPCTVTVKWHLREAVSGSLVASGTSKSESVAAGATVLLAATAPLVVARPLLWSVKSPTLYTLTTELWAISNHDQNSSATASASVLCDNTNTSIGLRAIKWDQQGFHLNGETTRIRGFSHHSDFGAVGGAVPDRINLFRAQALRSVGGNTWRTSHNP